MKGKVQCVACEHFTLQPRQAEDGNERLRGQDRHRAAIGWGRCAFYAGLSMHWLPGETDRTCDRHKPLDPDQVGKRRAWVIAQRPHQ